jgi:hypothetical protein
MGNVVDVGYVTDPKRLRDQLERAGERVGTERVQLWRFDHDRAARVDEVATVDEELVAMWWTAAVSTASSASYFVVTVVREGRPHQWLVLAPTLAATRSRASSALTNEQEQRERDQQALRMAGVGFAAGLRHRRKAR